MKIELTTCPETGQKDFSESSRLSGKATTRKPKSTRNANPVSRHFKLIAEGKRSRAAAIDAMCAHCMGCTAKEQGARNKDWTHPGFRKEIRNCSAPHCPLFEFRPFQKEGS